MKKITFVLISCLSVLAILTSCSSKNKYEAVEINGLWTSQLRTIKILNASSNRLENSINKALLDKYIFEREFSSSNGENKVVIQMINKETKQVVTERTGIYNIEKDTLTITVNMQQYSKERIILSSKELNAEQKLDREELQQLVNDLQIGNVVSKGVEGTLIIRDERVK